jgi:ABC-type molybdate transport system permease subunit
VTRHVAARVSGLSRLRTEPALVRSVVVAVVVLAGALGVSAVADVDDDTIDAIVTLIAVVGPVVAGLWTRFGVTPNGVVVAQVDSSSGTVVAGDAAAIATGSVIATRPNLAGTAAQLDEAIVVSPKALPIEDVAA